VSVQAWSQPGARKGPHAPGALLDPRDSSSMKTTLNLDDELLAHAKRRATEPGVTLTQVIEEALQTLLLAPASPQQFRLQLPTLRGDRPPPVDPADREVLYELMERGPVGR
jgi:hypothetical protein